MKSISAIHPTIMENTENMLVKCVPHISICESHNASISAMSNSFHNIVSWHKSSPYAIVKKEWEIKGVQR